MLLSVSSMGSDQYTGWPVLEFQLFISDKSRPELEIRILYLLARLLLKKAQLYNGHFRLFGRPELRTSRTEGADLGQDQRAWPKINSVIHLYGK